MRAADLKPSQALPRQLLRRGSQAVSPDAKVLGVMRKLPAMPLALPLGELSPQVTKGGIWHRAAMTERVTKNTAARPVETSRAAVYMKG